MGILDRQLAELRNLNELLKGGRDDDGRPFTEEQIDELKADIKQVESAIAGAPLGGDRQTSAGRRVK